MPLEFTSFIKGHGWRYESGNSLKWTKSTDPVNEYDTSIASHDKMLEYFLIALFISVILFIIGAIIFFVVMMRI